MGARAHMFPRLMQIMPEDMHFGFVGRPSARAPVRGIRRRTSMNKTGS